VDDTDTDLRNEVRWLFVAALGLFTYGAYCLVQAPRVREQADALPRMTCAQLIQNGPGANRFIALTDARLSDGTSVSERDSESGALEMYHPIYQAQLQQEPDPHDLRLVLCVMDEMERRRVRDDRDHRQQLGQPGLSELTGEVKTGAAHLPPWARRGLMEKYRGLPLDTCWVVIVGLYEPTALRAASFQRHGVISLLVAVVLFLGWWVWSRSTTGAIETDAKKETPIDDRVAKVRPSTVY
jgi:hypothetical protein